MDVNINLKLNGLSHISCNSKHPNGGTSSLSEVGTDNHPDSPSTVSINIYENTNRTAHISAGGSDIVE